MIKVAVKIKVVISHHSPIGSRSHTRFKTLFIGTEIGDLGWLERPLRTLLY